MPYSNPSVADFKARFNRDFPYNADIALGVTDTDIANAFQDANLDINPDIWGNQADYTGGYMLLAAHHLCVNIRNASQGIMGQGLWAQQSHGVGAVSQSVVIPQKVQENPALNAYSTTSYGLKYAVMAIQRTIGVMFTVKGTISRE